MRIAAATPSRPALEAAFAIARRGGGAVDCAIAATVAAMVTEVGICAPGSGGFVLVSDHGEAMAYDGYMAAPGLGGVPDHPNVIQVSMAYGGGVTTLVGPGSIGTPGIWDGMGAAHADHGQIAWADLFGPAITLARDGFGYGSASVTYLTYSHDLVYGRDPASSAVVHRPDGSVRGAGETILMPDLAESLETIAREGARSMHDGTLAERIAEDLRLRGAVLGWADLAGYRVERRSPLAHRCGEWEVDTNPAPAVGGEAMMGVLERVEERGPGVASMVDAQHEVFRRRSDGDPLRSPSTIHISVVDDHGSACALTASSGYGSGVIPSGTGIWMNNALGELELVPDARALTPGTRLVSNMAPTVCRHADGAVLAVGSPGADRITSALAQTLAAFLLEGRSLEDAVGQPRLHVILGDPPTVAIEPGLDSSDTRYPLQRFEDRHMFFGGVGAAMCDRSGRLTAVADPRRDGAAGILD